MLAYPLPTRTINNFESSFRDWKVAEKHFTKGTYEKGKKVIVAAIRLVALALQMATEDKISDYTACAKYSIAMTDDSSEMWDHYHAIYRPVFNDYVAKLKVACLEGNKKKKGG